MRITILIFIFLTAFYGLKAQVTGNRVEIELSGPSDTYDVIPAGAHGVVLIGESETVVKNGLIYDVSLYGTNFNKTWTLPLTVAPRSRMIHRHFDKEKGALYLLFGVRKRGYFKSDFEVFSVDLASKESRSLKGSFDSRALVTGFFAAGGVATFGGAYIPPPRDFFFKSLVTVSMLFIPAAFGSMRYKLKPFLFRADFNNNALSRTQTGSGGNTHISTITAGPGASHTTALLSSKKGKSDIQFKLLRFAPDSEIPEEITIEPEGTHDITAARILEDTAGGMFVTGSYFPRAKRWKESYTGSAGPQVNPATGIYFAHYSNGRQDFIKTYSFSAFKNFFSFMSPRQQQRAMRRAARSESKTYAYNLLFHEPLRTKEGIVVIGEAFYPEYDIECYTSFNPNGTTSQRCSTVFVGYRFTHALAACFDVNGTLLWDKCFPILDILTYDIRPRVVHLADGDDILLLYSLGETLKSMLLSANDSESPKTVLNISTGIAGDGVKNNYGSGVEYWYDNYFIAYGYQKIKNTSGQGKTRRKVFYFTKIAYQ